MTPRRFDERRYVVTRFDVCQYVVVNAQPLDTVDVVACCSPILEAPLSEEAAVELAGVLKVLADPARLRLLSLIAAAGDGQACACDLNEPLERTQATVSHHLGQLVKAGLLQREQRGRWAWFRVDRQRLDAVRQLLGPQ